jgi:hypothetical protein
MSTIFNNGNMERFFQDGNKLTPTQDMFSFRGIFKCPCRNILTLILFQLFASFRSRLFAFTKKKGHFFSARLCGSHSLPISKKANTVPILKL